MDPSDLAAAGAALLAAVLGAAVSYVAATRAARRAAAAAWAANTISLAQALIESDDPATRRAGSTLLAAAVRAVADAEETPERIKQATRSGDLADAVDAVRTLEEVGGSPAEIELAPEAASAEEVPDGQGPRDPQAGRRRES